jgi:hypothetical protein
MGGKRVGGQVLARAPISRLPFARATPTDAAIVEPSLIENSLAGIAAAEIDLLEPPPTTGTELVLRWPPRTGAFNGSAA